MSRSNVQNQGLLSAVHGIFVLIFAVTVWLGAVSHAYAIVVPMAQCEVGGACVNCGTAYPGPPKQCGTFNGATGEFTPGTCLQGILPNGTDCNFCFPNCSCWQYVDGTWRCDC